MEKTTNIFDVLSGKESVKAEVGISKQTIFYLGLAVVVVILVGTLIIKRA